MHLPANDGGCWFCETDDDPPMVFQTEFDSFVHEQCVVEKMYEGNLEAFIIANELGIPIPPGCEEYNNEGVEDDSETTNPETAFEGVTFNE